MQIKFLLSWKISRFSFFSQFPLSLLCFVVEQKQQMEPYRMSLPCRVRCCSWVSASSSLSLTQQCSLQLHLIVPSHSLSRLSDSFARSEYETALSRQRHVAPSFSSSSHPGSCSTHRCSLSRYKQRRSIREEDEDEEKEEEEQRSCHDNFYGRHRPSCCRVTVLFSDPPIHPSLCAIHLIFLPLSRIFLSSRLQQMQTQPSSKPLTNKYKKRSRNTAPLAPLPNLNHLPTTERCSSTFIPAEFQHNQNRLRDKNSNKE